MTQCQMFYGQEKQTITVVILWNSMWKQKFIMKNKHHYCRLYHLRSYNGKMSLFFIFIYHYEIKYFKNLSTCTQKFSNNLNWKWLLKRCFSMCLHIIIFIWIIWSHLNWTTIFFTNCRLGENKKEHIGGLNL